MRYCTVVGAIFPQNDEHKSSCFSFPCILDCSIWFGFHSDIYHFICHPYAPPRQHNTVTSHKNEDFSICFPHIARCRDYGICNSKYCYKCHITGTHCGRGEHTCRYILVRKDCDKMDNFAVQNYVTAAQAVTDGTMFFPAHGLRCEHKFISLVKDFRSHHYQLCHILLPNIGVNYRHELKRL